MFWSMTDKNLKAPLEWMLGKHWFCDHPECYKGANIYRNYPKGTWIPFHFSKEDVRVATEFGETIGKLRGSFTHGLGNTAGILGEWGASQRLFYEPDHTRAWDCKDIEGLPVDIKTKGVEKPAPNKSWVGSITASCLDNEHEGRHAHAYVFVCVNTELLTGWILGYCRRDQFMAAAAKAYAAWQAKDESRINALPLFFRQKGEVDVTKTSQVFKYPADSFNCLYSWLYPPSQIVLDYIQRHMGGEHVRSQG